MDEQADEEWSAWETASVEECRRQASQAAAADAKDVDLLGFLDAALADFDETAEVGTPSACRWPAP